MISSTTTTNFVIMLSPNDFLEPNWHISKKIQQLLLCRITYEALQEMLLQVVG
jgi:hypothetical protein